MDGDRPPRPELSTRRRRGPRGQGWTGLLLLALAGLTVPAAPAVAAPLDSCYSDDNGDPVLDGLTLNPTTIDVTGRGKPIRITATVHDTGGPGDATQVSAITLWARPEKEGLRWSFARLARGPDGTWAGNLWIPRGSAAGTWRLATLTVTDAAGNRLARESGNAVASLAATVGFPTTFRVVSHPDVTPPRLTSFELTPRRLDTTISGKTVRFTVRAADAESAIDVVRVNTWQRNVRPRMLDMKLARTARDTYVGEIRIPPHVGDWGWSVGVNITNRVGIRGAWNPDSLRNLGFRADIEVRSADPILPVVGKYAPSPVLLDVRTVDQTLTVSVGASAGSGVTSVVARMAAAWQGGRQLRLMSGTATKGMWTGTVRVPRCWARTGSYRPWIWVTDASGYSRAFGPSYLADAPSLGITGRDNQLFPPTGIGPDAQGKLRLAFPEDVNGITSGTAPVYESDTGGIPAGGDLRPGTWTCRDVSGALTDCATGLVRKAAFHPDTPLDPDRFARVILNPEHQLGVTDLAGNPYDRAEVRFR